MVLGRHGNLVHLRRLVTFEEVQRDGGVFGGFQVLALEVSVSLLGNSPCQKPPAGVYVDQPDPLGGGLRFLDVLEVGLSVLGVVVF